MAFFAIITFWVRNFWNYALYLYSTLLMNFLFSPSDLPHEPSSEVVRCHLYYPSVASHLAVVWSDGGRNLLWRVFQHGLALQVDVWGGNSRPPLWSCHPFSQDHRSHFGYVAFFPQYWKLISAVYSLFIITSNRNCWGFGFLGRGRRGRLEEFKARRKWKPQWYYCFSSLYLSLISLVNKDGFLVGTDTACAVEVKVEDLQEDSEGQGLGLPHSFSGADIALGLSSPSSSSSF